MSETVKSKLFWIAVGSLIGLFITEGYNFINSQINPQAIHIPEVIPIVLGILGTSLLSYILIQNRRNKEGRVRESEIIDKIKEQQKQEELERNREEIRQLEEGEASDPNRQGENRDRYRPTGFK